MSKEDRRNLEISGDNSGMPSSPDRRRWKALSVIALVQFILVLDITVVNVALPHIQFDLGFSRAGLAWVVDGYVLTAGGLILLGARLGDLLGRRRMFLVGVSVFAVASALSGAAVDPAMLVASRFAQGIGEALAGPAAFGLIALLFTEPKERAQAIGIFGGVAGLGGTLGPVISGLLIAAGSWRWIFFVNIPVAIFALVAVARLVTESRAERDPERAGSRPDVAGAVLATAGLSGIVYGFISAGTDAWGSTSVVVSLAIGSLLLLGFVLRERYAGAPLVPAGFLRNRTRVTANVTSFFFFSVFFAMFFLLTLYFQEVQHFSALRTGLAYLPFGIVIGLGIGVSSTLVQKVGIRILLCAGFLCVAAGVLLLSRITVHGSYLTEALPGLVVMAFGSGICFAAFGNASMHEVSGQDASLASGVQSTAQQVSGAVGLAILATLALRHARAAVAHGVASTVASTNGAAAAFRIGAVVALAGGIIVAAIRFGGPVHAVEPVGAPSASDPSEPSSTGQVEPASV
jgi:EmrB/QacA subfamily drug resistance transporter